MLSENTSARTLLVVFYSYALRMSIVANTLWFCACLLWVFGPSTNLNWHGYSINERLVCVRLLTATWSQKKKTTNCTCPRKHIWSKCGAKEYIVYTKMDYQQGVVWLHVVSSYIPGLRLRIVIGLAYLRSTCSQTFVRRFPEMTIWKSTYNSCPWMCA